MQEVPVGKGRKMASLPHDERDASGKKGDNDMKFFSTRDHSRIVTASEAIAQGLAPNEGGLFVPESFPQVDVEAGSQLYYPELAAAVLS